MFCLFELCDPLWLESNWKLIGLGHPKPPNRPPRKGDIEFHGGFFSTFVQCFLLKKQQNQTPNKGSRNEGQGSESLRFTMKNQHFHVLATPRFSTILRPSSPLQRRSREAFFHHFRSFFLGRVFCSVSKPFYCQKAHFSEKCSFTYTKPLLLQVRRA